MSTDDPTNPQMPVGGDGPCPTCGATVPAAARFCPNCGTPRAEADAPDPGGSDSTRVMAPVTDTGPVYEEEVATRTAPVVAGERPWPWALTLGVPAAILLLLLVVLAVRSFGDDDGTAPDETTTTSAAPATTVTTTRSVVTSAPRVTQPPATSPPQTNPPQTDPPATDPPATDPPVTATVVP
jgi:hypothetical protein